MRMGVGRTIFPSWAAATTLVQAHGVQAAEHAARAISSGTVRERLEHAVLAMTSFDHAVDNVQKLPVQLLVRGSAGYFRGYEAARKAVQLIVGSGVVPGAKELVGRQSLVAARNSFLAGVQISATDGSRYGGHLASGWIDASGEDARAGVKLLSVADPLGRSLLSGIEQVRTAAARRAQLDPLLVRTVTDLFAQVGARLDAAVARAEREALATGWVPARAPVRGDAADRLLGTSGDAARSLLRDADGFRQDIDRMSALGTGQ